MEMVIEKISKEKIQPLRVTHQSATAGEKEYFTDNPDYLPALEREARIRLISACMRKNGNGHSHLKGKESEVSESKSEDTTNGIDFDLLEIPLGGKAETGLRILVDVVAEENRALAEKSLRRGIDLPFETLCKSFNLDPFERTVVLLLFAKSNNPLVQQLLEKHAPPHWTAQNGGMKIRAILDIATSDLREQLGYRKYFDISSSLIKEDIIISEIEHTPTTNILDTEVHLHERIVRHILGDKNRYATPYRFISRDRMPIDLERVILPENIKEEVLKLAENYSLNKSSMRSLGIHDFYGYGRGLTFLFHGPSGTGKTMLAHALAHRLNMDLLSLNMQEKDPWDGNILDAIKYIFKEARLSGGIAFFDECDDLFLEGSVQSRSLLIEIEKADCITIFATNKVDELDPSLDRRINLQVPFYLPDESQREKIWRASVPPNAILSEDVDFSKLAEEFVLTGGLIKNAIFMAIQNGIGKNDPSKIFLDRKGIEKAAAYQMAGMLKQKEIKKVYQPKNRLKDLGVRSQEEKWFQRLVLAYKKYQGKGFALNLVIGSSDLQAGIDCVNGVARECNLAVRRFTFFELFGGDHYASRRIRNHITARPLDKLDDAFKVSPDREDLVMFVDPDSLFEQLLRENEENRIKDFADFLAKLRSFQGMFFLVTKPVNNLRLPTEIHHYIEIKCPPEEIQIRRWEAHFKKNGFTEDEIIDLVEKYPMHLNEIDYIARQASIRATLNENEGIPSLECIYEVFKRFKGRRETPVLFDGRK